MLAIAARRSSAAVAERRRRGGFAMTDSINTDIKAGNTDAEAGPRDPTRIRGYHAHVYYDPAAGGSRERAARVREGVAAAFPEARLGSWHDAPVGPHPRAM